jgi:putative sugar O-methyltransferase
VDDINLTLDRLASVIEIQRVKDQLDRGDDLNICEIGEGSGRTADSIFHLYPNAKYLIADIPPALFISYERLRIAFPD